MFGVPTLGFMESVPVKSEIDRIQPGGFMTPSKETDCQLVHKNTPYLVTK